MHSTRASLILRIRKGDDSVSWARFTDLYTPMIYRWARNIGLPEADAADLAQDVLVTVFNEIKKFEYDKKRSFRAWLKTITLNRAKNVLRRRANHAVPDGSVSKVSVPDEIEFLSEREYNTKLAQRALEIMKLEFEESTWKACWRSIVDGMSASDVSAELGITQNAVYLAKSRVLRRLRMELDGLLEPDALA